MTRHAILNKPLEVAQPEPVLLLQQEMKPDTITVKAPSQSSSVISGAAIDASKIFFDVLGCEPDKMMIEKFMETPDGRRLAAGLSRMLTYINEHNISRLEKGLL